jgi:RNA polymerase sigma factor (sigma-70 family)
MPNPALTTLLRHVRSTADRAAECPLSDPDLLARFLAGRDEAAFATLVRRHGGLVLAACRRVLSDPADVEDAFQATFVVLLRKAETIRHQQSLAGWLYRVASRAASQVRESRDCRRRHETRAASPEVAAATAPDLSWRETSAILHAELDRLPLRLRLPLILCYFDGKTRDEAAKQLGWSLGVLRGRLDSGRAMLRKRLARRGVELSAGLFAALGVDATRAVTPSLLRATIRAATSVAGLCEAGGGTAAIAGRVIASMTFAKAAIAGTLLALGLVIAGTTALLVTAGAPPDDKMPAPAKQAPQAVATANAETFPVAGQVLDPDGKPVAGAKLFICDKHGRSPAPKPFTDADGRFRFTLDAPFTSIRTLVATADGFGADWSDVRPTEPATSLSLRLPPDMPIRGKVVDLEGKPVAGATVQVVELSTSESGNIDDFLKRWAEDKEKSVTGPTFHLITAKSVWPRDGLRQLFATMTAADGTFRLTGIGRDRSVMLGVRGPGVADHYHRLLTRPDFRAGTGQGQTAISGPEPIIAVPPGKSIVGTVRDARTKLPLAGLRVLAYTPDQPMHWWQKSVEAVTDAEGRYRLAGLTKARHVVLCDPGTGAPHMHRFEEVSDTEGFAPVTQDIDLLTGIVVSGQVTDRATGRPVRARVVYAPLLNNPHFNATPGYAAPRTRMSLWVDSREMITGPDGRYQLTALPGPGGLFVRAVSATYAAPPPPTKEDRDGGVYHEKAETFFTIGLGDIFPLPDIHAYRIIRPVAEVVRLRTDARSLTTSATDLTADFALETGCKRQGRLLDPDGRPLTGARFVGLNASPRRSRNLEPLPGAEFTAEALNLAKPRRLLFWHEDRKLAGTVVLRGDEPEPVTVTLHPLATLTGRALSKTGEPLVGHAVEYSGWPELRLPHEDGKRRDESAVPTDADGRFRLTGLPAGVPLAVSVIVPKTRFATIHRDKIVLEPGQTKNLGELRGDPMPE